MEDLANEIIQTVQSEDCRRLIYPKLSALLELVINNENVVDILKTVRISDYDDGTDNCFTIAYSNYQNGNRQFRLMNDINSLALSWLFLLYH